MSENTLRTITVVKRDSLATLSSVSVSGQEYTLGIHRDLRGDPVLARFIPEDARLSVAWVHLGTGEVLDTHKHPIDSMVILSAGQGRLVGDRTAELSEGDVVAIPRGCLHGFVGGGPGGFWGLSIQFERRGLYEQPSEPLVAFTEEHSFAELMRRNEKLMREHSSNAIFAFVQSDRVANEVCRGRLLDCIQVWSGYFQKVLMARMLYSSEPRFLRLAREHFSEEYGHDLNLASTRGGRGQTVSDPILEAYSSWFVSQMSSIGDAEKTVLVHLVFEACSSVFHNVARPIMARFEETDHFAIHDVADDHHLSMAFDSLRGLAPETYARCLRVQKQGWEMFNALNARMAEIAEAAG